MSKIDEWITRLEAYGFKSPSIVIKGVYPDLSVTFKYDSLDFYRLLKTALDSGEWLSLTPNQTRAIHRVMKDDGPFPVCRIVASAEGDYAVVYDTVQAHRDLFTLAMAGDIKAMLAEVPVDVKPNEILEVSSALA